MGEICIHSFGLDIAPRLAQALNARMAKTTLVDSADAPAGETGPACDALVISKSLVEKLGGTEALLEFARKAKARRILIIQEDADAPKSYAARAGVYGIWRWVVQVKTLMASLACKWRPRL